MTPRDVDRLTDPEWAAMVQYMKDEARAADRAQRRRTSTRRGGA